MPRGGRRPGAGRKKGSATKRTRQVADAAAADGRDPLTYMLSVVSDPTASPSAARRNGLCVGAFLPPAAQCGGRGRGFVEPAGATQHLYHSERRASRCGRGDPIMPMAPRPRPPRPSFRPFTPTPDLPRALPSPEPAPAEPLPVHELDEDGDKIGGVERTIVARARSRRSSGQPDKIGPLRPYYLQIVCFMQPLLDLAFMRVYNLHKLCSKVEAENDGVRLCAGQFAGAGPERHRRPS